MAFFKRTYKILMNENSIFKYELDDDDTHIYFGS